jgi:hypothetical protein
MIDHNFADLPDGDSKKRKILCKDWGDNEADINKIICKNLITCTNPAFFIGNYVIPANSKKKLTKIHDDIKDLQIHNNFDIENYEDLLYIHLGHLMNNRIGTPIRSVELNNIDDSNDSNFQKGELVIQRVRDDYYIIVLFLGINDENTYNCLSRNANKNIINIEVDKSELYHYTRFEEIQQDIIPGDSALTIDNLIETYII